MRKRSKPSIFRDHFALYWQTYLACLGFGVLFLVAGAFYLRRESLEKERYSWPIAEATVRAVKYSEQPEFGKIGVTVNGDLWLEVTYSANGIIRQGEVFQSFQGPLGTSPKQEFSIGQSVRIRYNPKAPSEIYLDTSGR